MLGVGNHPRLVLLPPRFDPIAWSPRMANHWSLQLVYYWTLRNAIEHHSAKLGPNDDMAASVRPALFHRRVSADHALGDQRDHCDEYFYTDPHLHPGLSCRCYLLANDYPFLLKNPRLRYNEPPDRRDYIIEHIEKHLRGVGKGICGCVGEAHTPTYTGHPLADDSFQCIHY